AVLGMLAVVAVIARAEAEGLRARHGAAYDEYARKVHAFMPRLRPVPATATIEPDWVNGLSTGAGGALLPGYLAALALSSVTFALAIVAIMFAGLLHRRVANRRAREKDAREKADHAGKPPEGSA